MFLAIINDTYAEVKSELHEDDEFPIMQYFKNHYQGLLNKLGAQRDQIEGIQAALTLDGNKKLSYEHVRAELKKRDLTDPEIEMLFAKYDLDCNRELDSEELSKLLNDLEGKKLALDKQIEHEQANRPTSALSRHQFGLGGEDMVKLVRRVDRMEHTLMAISGKIDSALAGKLIIPKGPPEVGVTQASDDENEATKRWAN